MLYMAHRKGLPVILHCRDSGRRTLQLILSNDLGRLKYYRHRFDGNLAELQAWQQLPNIIFGVSGKFMTSPIGKEIIPSIPSDQLVLETDLSLHPCCPTNHPWNLPDIAVEVNRLRNVPLPVLMWTVNENSLRFFGIPKPMDRARSEAFGPGLARREMLRSIDVVYNIQCKLGMANRSEFTNRLLE